MNIILDDLTHPKVTLLLAEHLQDMYNTSPAESVHALDLSQLQQPNIRFWTAWQGQDLLGCAALKTLSATHGEIKSMRTAKNHILRGVGQTLLEHLIKQAREHSFNMLSLETGSQAFFRPAIALYQRFGFEFCQPFADYKDDINSKFMRLRLVAPSEL